MTGTVVRQPSLWERHAHQFARMGPPLRPSPEDLDTMRAEVGARSQDGRATRVLVMGVTPELAELGDHTLAVDLNPAMIRGVWPGFRGRPDSYACGDWSHLPVRDGSRDIVLCDGGLTLLGFPHDYERWAREVHRVLSPGGVAVLRAFVLPDEPERAEGVLEDLARGEIDSFHAFKWRLAMALQESPEDGVAVHDVWTVWDREGRGILERAGGGHWPADVVRTIEAYRGLSARLCFPTLEQVRAALSDRLLTQRVVVPTYELGTRCPTLVLSPRHG